MQQAVNDIKDINKAIEDDRRAAEYYLLHYETELQQYNLARETYVDARPADDNVGGGRSGLGDKTAMATLKGIEFDEEHTDKLRWLKAVRYCRAGLGERKNIFIACRMRADNNGYRNGSRGRRAWVVCTQQYYLEEIEKRFLSAEHISERSIISWWKEIIERTMAIANKI